MELKHAILGLLSIRSASGYDLARAFASSVAHFWHADRSQIYRTLDRLSGAGAITTEVVRQDGKPDRKVGAYSLWNLSGGWEATKQLTLRAGVQNLANKAPPFSQQAWFFISGYDPSYTDSRGRFVYASAKYTFR